MGIHWCLGSTGNCRSIRSRITRKSFILNRQALRLADGDLQKVFNCMPEGTQVLVDLDEIPTKGGLVIIRPVQIQSRNTNMKVLITGRGIKVRCVCSFTSSRCCTVNVSHYCLLTMDILCSVKALSQPHIQRKLRENTTHCICINSESMNGYLYLPVCRGHLISSHEMMKYPMLV